MRSAYSKEFLDYVCVDAQEWLGHSDMSTTANIYSHLDAVTKAQTGAAMIRALG